MTPEQVSEYMEGGYTWAIDGDGPTAFNCWNFLRHIQRKHFRKELPEALLDNEEFLRAMFVENMQAGVWQPVYPPNHGDAVLLKGGSDPHVGVYLDIDGGMVLHAMRGFNILATPLRNLSMLSFGRVIYYRINKEIPDDDAPAA